MQLMHEFYKGYSDKVFSYESNTDMPRNRICVAGIFAPYPFHPRDHIFWGNTADLLDLYNIDYDLSPHPAYATADYRFLVRSESYIGARYCSKFFSKILQYISNPELYLFDFAPKIQESLALSDDITEKIFKTFPKIDMEWPKYGLKEYYYDFTKLNFGEIWHS